MLALAEYLHDQGCLIFEKIRRWFAQHYHSVDDIPYIGLASRFAKNSYIATGCF